MNSRMISWMPWCGYRQLLHNVNRDIRVPADLKGVKEPPEASGASETLLAIPFHGRAEIRTTQL
ncbi:MAG: hypothetical protein J4F40_17635 [Alphaproteobacteria bacterium]|nr:hypothetical protein [Alphaproteobacteria bacterium]